MNELKIIEQRKILGQDFKIYGDFENPLFLAKDIAEMIGYDKSSINKMLNNVDEEEKILLASEQFSEGIQMNTKYWFLTEDGLYEVLMQSRKPIAKAFKKEVKKILKELRKTGYYIINNELEEIKAKAQLERAEAMKINAEVRKLQELNRMTCNDLVISKEGFYTLERIKKRNARLFKNQIFQKLQEIYDLINEFDYID